MNPLDTATTEELMDEIRRRSEAGIIIIAGHDRKIQGTFAGKSWGSNMWKIGACRFMESESLNDLMGESDAKNDEPGKERPDAMEP